MITPPKQMGRRLSRTAAMSVLSEPGAWPNDFPRDDPAVAENVPKIIGEVTRVLPGARGPVLKAGLPGIMICAA